MNRSPDPHIYYIRPIGQDGPVKVGFSIHAHQRLRECMKWSPVPLEIAAMVPIEAGSSKRDTGEQSRFERRFHLRYADYHLHSEWFEAHPLILADIEAIRSGSFDATTLPEWGKIYKARTSFRAQGDGSAVAPAAIPTSTARQYTTDRTAGHLISSIRIT